MIYIPDGRLTTRMLGVASNVRQRFYPFLGPALPRSLRVNWIRTRKGFIVAGCSQSSFTKLALLVDDRAKTWSFRLTSSKP